jgi:ubiquinone/menaquinone biosynthesis C-methylase UbiE
MAKNDHLSRQLRAMPAFRGLLRAVEAKVYDEIKLAEPVLDVGCGDGHFASEVFKRPLQAGIDPWWPPLLEAARQHRSAYDVLVQCDGKAMPFPDNHFASAISNSVLEHIPHIDSVLQEVYRVLKPGAQFIFCSPSENFLPFLSISGGLRKIGLKGMAHSYETWFNRICRHEHCDSPATWEKRLNKAGLKVHKSWYYFSKDALQALEWGHYWGLPSLITKKLFGRWIVWPSDANLWLTDKLLRKYYEEPLPKQGAYLFVIAYKPKQK